MDNQDKFTQIVALAKRRGFVYQTSDIYGGLANSYDYGPMGVELLRHIKNLWWQEFITKRSDMVGLDSQIMLHPETWVASGHVASFNDIVVEDTVTHKRYRTDHLIESWVKQHADKFPGFIVEELDMAAQGEFIKTHHLKSPDGNPVTQPKKFNQLFETSIGALSGEKSKIYLRGETAQGIFANFKQVLDSSRVQLPFGIGQIGKSFRNEITTGQFIFRTLEFEQAEIEYFFDPETADWHDLLEQWKQAMFQFVTQILGVNPDNLRWRRHTDTERSHYSQDTYDLDYHFPFGWKELWGVAYRGDYDLTQHMKHSGKNLKYRDPQNPQREFTPHVIEPAVGITRIFLMLLSEGIFVEPESHRTILHLKPTLAPYQVAVFPLLANKARLIDRAKEIFKSLSQIFPVAWDQRGNIGKRYAAQDEIGTPFCITVDFDTLKDNSVTVRFRDSAQQERIQQSQLVSYLNDQFNQ